MNKNKIALLLGIVCCLLTIAICVQIKTMEDAEKEVGKTTANNDGLRDEILTIRDRYNSTYKELESSEEELEQIRAQAVANNTEDADKERQIKKINEFLGYTELKGPGIIITLDDNRDVVASEVANISDYLVHDVDLRKIVNELFNMEAEAVSINDQRVVSTTGIICDGNIIRVNGEIIGVPITIKAIGLPETLYYQMIRPYGYLEYIKDVGVIVNVEQSNEITIPKYEGVYSHDYIK